MTDVFDRATEREERDREEALAAAISHKPEVPSINCQDCAAPGEPVGQDCQYYAGCLQDWQRREWARKQGAV